MKKLLAIVLTVVLAMTVLAGCGEKAPAETQAAPAETQAAAPAETEAAAPAETEAAAPAETEAAEQTQPNAAEVLASIDPADYAGKKVGFTLPSVGNDFMLYLSEAVKATLAELGAECQVDACNGDVNLQIQQIENYATMGMDVIVVFPVNGEALTSVCQKVMSEGTPVFAFAMQIPDGADTQMLSAEEADMGAACGNMANEWINANLEGDITVYALMSSATPESTDRSNAITTALEANANITNLIIEETEDWNSSDAARTRIENAFLVNPDIDVVVAVNGTTAKGVEAYIASPDCPVEDLSKFAIFCVDEDEEIVAKIKASATNESTLRGTISMGSIQDTVNDFMAASAPIFKGEEPIAVWKGSTFVLTAETYAE